MNRRGLITGAAALLVSSTALGQTARSGRVFEHSEIKTLWAVLGDSRDLLEAQDRLRHWGPLPWTFTGTIRMGTARDNEPIYERATVLVIGIENDERAVVTGFEPSALVSYQVAEPIRMSGPPKLFRVRYAR